MQIKSFTLLLHKMISRKIHHELINLANQYPVVSVIGPRQAGKTTLVRSAFPSTSYVNLELPENRNLAANDPKAFFHRYTSPLIIDEIQRVPELLSYIQVIVDEHNSAGQFILTGSDQLQLSEEITQSLAGRTAILKLLTFSISELLDAGISHTRDEWIAKGFLPRIYDQKLEPFKAYGNYLETYVERDLRKQINIRNLATFEAFLKLLAGRVGQVLNLQSLSNDLGVSSPTIQQWISILEASFVVFRIYPYYKNFGKRIIKSPKLYFTEVGLAVYLLGIQNKEQVSRDPLLGGIFENLVVADILKSRLNAGLPPNLYFFRDSNGNEVDLVIEENRSLTAVEIKSAMTYKESFTRGIDYFQKINLNNQIKKGVVIYAGGLEFESDSHIVRNFSNIEGLFYE